MRDWVTESSPARQGPAYAALHWVRLPPTRVGAAWACYILGTAERIAKDDGKLSVCCDIYEDNVPMRELLLSYGYEFCGNVEILARLGRVKRRAVVRARRGEAGPSALSEQHLTEHRRTRGPSATRGHG